MVVHSSAMKEADLFYEVLWAGDIRGVALIITQCLQESAALLIGSKPRCREEKEEEEEEEVVVVSVFPIPFPTFFFFDTNFSWN